MAYSPELLEEMMKAQDAFVWESPSWEKRLRGPRWYIIMSVIAMIFVIYAILTSNFLFAFMILLGAIILVLAGNQEPRTILVQIGRNGVVVDGSFYEYPSLQNFSIVYNPPQTKLLYIEPKSSIRPRVKIFLGDQNPLEIRAHLKAYLDENLDLQDEHVSDIVARLLKI